jgi:nucleoside-diphosphate-sugar epimerase
LKKVLVTGANGFVGRSVVKCLLDRNVQVTCILREGNPDNNFWADKNVVMCLTQDIFEEDEDWYFNVFKDIDTIIHCAWYAKHGDYLHSEKNLSCLSGSLKLGKSASLAGVKRFIGIGSCAEYDIAHEVLDVFTPLKPLNLYAATKVSAYYCLSNYFINSSTQFAWCRLFYLYGEGEDSNRFVSSIKMHVMANKPIDLTDCSQIRDYLDIRIAGEKIVNVALGDLVGPVNICSGEKTVLRDLAVRVANEYGEESLLRFGLRKRNDFDPDIVVGIPYQSPKP